LKELKTKLRLKSAELLVVLILFLFSLRVLNWFEYPQILISGDSRPPLIQDAFSKRVAYTWDETDFGMPSVYAPRILVPSYFFMTVFQTFGASLFTAQMTALFLMFFFSSALTFMLVKRFTNGNFVASFVAALYLTSNLYMINDREVTAIAFLDVALVILPCLVAFTEGIRRRSYTFIAFSGVLFVLTYGAFPNFRIVLLCLISVAMVLLFAFTNKGLRILYRQEEASRRLGFSVDLNSIQVGLKYVSTFIFAGLLASIWMITMIWTNFGVFFQAYTQMAAPQFVLDVRLPDVLRLITKWGFYSGYMGQPYVPYANNYLQNSLVIFLSFLPPILAFASLFISKSRRLTIYFSATAVVFLVLTAAFTPLFNQLYIALVSNIPLMLAFRESAQWSFFVIISYSILIGITISTLCNKFRSRITQMLVLSLTIIILLASAYPLTTGDVARNYLNTNVKGSYFPNSYAQLNDALSNEYWALLLPQKYTYETYNFSGIPFGSGNPYPLIFSKPIISGLGTEYIQSNNVNLLNKVYESVLATEEVNVTPLGIALASSTQKDGFEPSKAIDGDSNTRWSLEQGMPQWLEIDWNQTQELSRIKIAFEFAYANNYTIQTWNGTNWATQTEVKNNTSLETEYVFPQFVPTTKLRINFTEALPFDIISIWELQVYAIQSEPESKSLGILGIKYLVLEKDMVGGNAYNVNDVKAGQSKNFVLSNDWKEVALYNNTNAVQKLYPADNILNFTTFDDMFQTIRKTEWATLQQSVFLNSTLTSITESNALVPPENFAWSETSPTSYVAHAQSKGAFVLVFLESYDKQWKVSVNGNPILETNHFKVNGFANAWLIENTGDLTITVQYQTQTVFVESVIASIVLPALLLAYLGRKDLKKIGGSIHRMHACMHCDLLTEVHRVLKRGDKIVITTPNVNAIAKLLKGNQWVGFSDPSHLYLFTSDSLKFLVEKNGFIVIKLETIFHPFPEFLQKILNRTGKGGEIWLVGKKI